MSLSLIAFRGIFTPFSLFGDIFCLYILWLFSVSLGYYFGGEFCVCWIVDHLCFHCTCISTKHDIIVQYISLSAWCLYWFPSHQNHLILPVCWIWVDIYNHIEIIQNIYWFTGTCLWNVVPKERCTSMFVLRIKKFKFVHIKIY